MCACFGFGAGWCQYHCRGPAPHLPIPAWQGCTRTDWSSATGRQGPAHRLMPCLTQRHQTRPVASSPAPPHPGCYISARLPSLPRSPPPPLHTPPFAAVWISERPRLPMPPRAHRPRGGTASGGSRTWRRAWDPCTPRASWQDLPSWTRGSPPHPPAAVPSASCGPRGRRAPVPASSATLPGPATHSTPCHGSRSSNTPTSTPS